jgi:hypothetical protein
MPRDGSLCGSCNVIRSFSRALEKSNNLARFHKIMGNRKVVKAKIKINTKFVLYAGSYSFITIN